LKIYMPHTGTAGRENICWTPRSSLPPEEILDFVLDTADLFKEVSTRSVKKVPALRAVWSSTVSSRTAPGTCTSFALAAQRLSADLIDSLAQQRQQG
jgi:aspartate carbamoyltransferase catalytic subunit